MEVIKPVEMTIHIKVKDGSCYALWRVTKVFITAQGATVEHSHDIPSHIQGFIEFIKRVS